MRGVITISIWGEDAGTTGTSGPFYDCHQDQLCSLCELKSAVWLCLVSCRIPEIELFRSRQLQAKHVVRLQVSNAEIRRQWLQVVASLELMDCHVGDLVTDGDGERYGNTNSFRKWGRPTAHVSIWIDSARCFIQWSTLWISREDSSSGYDQLISWYTNQEEKVAPTVVLA
jgi:hypothetical protein